MVESGHQSDKKNSEQKKPPIRQSDIQNVAPESQVDINNLTPNNLIHLQRALGNKFVLNMTNTKAPDVKSDATNKSIQRAGTRSIHDQEHTVDDPGINDLIGTIGDYVGTDPTEGMSLFGDNGTGDAMTGTGSSDAVGTGTSVVSILTGLVGTGMGTYNLVQNARMHSQANEALKQYKTSYKGSGNIPGDTELFATVEMLKRKRSDAIKGEWENAGNVLGGISGMVNGIAGLLSGATAAMVAGVAFGVGAGINALVGTISAIRDFVNAGKRAKTQKEIGRVRAAYAELYGNLGSKAGAKKLVNEQRQEKVDQLTQDNQDLLLQVSTKTSNIVDANKELDKKREDYEKETSVTKKQTLIADMMLLKPRISKLQAEAKTLSEQAEAKEKEAQTIGLQIADTASEINDIEQKYDEYGKIITGLTTAERKQGYGGKIVSGVINLVGAAGGAALLAATLGAAAAAGPVGWILSGVALVSLIGYAAGMHIKRKIRESNVKRMNQEKTLLVDYIENGTLTTGYKLPTGYTIGADKEARKKQIWHRSMFPTTEKKGWFNKLISKKRSGTMDMETRLKQVEDYLGKYDMSTKGDIVAAGFIKALAPGDEGNQKVKNPAYSDDLSPELKSNTPQEVELRTLNEGLLEHFFPGKMEHMKSALLSTDATNPQKRQDAKDLLIKKLKLGG